MKKTTAKYRQVDVLILSLLLQTPLLSAEDLAIVTGWHAMTIRRHLARLEAEQVVESVHLPLLGTSVKAVFFITTTGVRHLEPIDPIRCACAYAADPIALVRQLPQIARFTAVQAVCARMLTMAQRIHPANTLQVTWKRTIREAYVAGATRHHIVLDASLLLTIGAISYGIWIILDDGVMSQLSMNARMRHLAAYARTSEATMPTVVIVTHSSARTALWHNVMQHRSLQRLSGVVLCEHNAVWPLVCDGRPAIGGRSEPTLHRLGGGPAAWSDLFQGGDVETFPRSMQPIQPRNGSRRAAGQAFLWTAPRSLPEIVTLLAQGEDGAQDTPARVLLHLERRPLVVLAVIAVYGSIRVDDLALVCGNAVRSVQNSLSALGRERLIIRHHLAPIDDDASAIITLSEQGAAVLEQIYQRSVRRRMASGHDASVAHLCVQIGHAFRGRIAWQVGTSCALPYRENGTYRMLIPDAMGMLLNNHVEIWFGIEWDAGTENAEQWDRKLQHYTHYLRWCEGYRLQRTPQFLLVVVPYSFQYATVVQAMHAAQGQSSVFARLPVYLTTSEQAQADPMGLVWTCVGPDAERVNPLQQFL